jgi:hypothetical protein
MFEIEFDTGVHNGYKHKILSEIETIELEGPTDALEETNRQVAIAKAYSEQDSLAKMEDFAVNVRMFTVTEVHRSLFHPLATVRHRM